MRGRFPNEVKDSAARVEGVTENDKPITVNSVILWPSVPDPLVRLDFERGSKMLRLFLNAQEARALGELLISESDKIVLATRHIEYSKTKAKE